MGLLVTIFVILDHRVDVHIGRSAVGEYWYEVDGFVCVYCEKYIACAYFILVLLCFGSINTPCAECANKPTCCSSRKSASRYSILE